MFGFARKLAKRAEGLIAPLPGTTGPTYGFRVMYTEPDSEAFHSGLEPLFDYVIAVNGQRFDQQYFDSQGSDSRSGDAADQAANAANGFSGLVRVEQEQSPFEDFEIAVGDTRERLLLEVWSAKGKTTRIVVLPNPAKQANGLGFEVRWCPLSVADHVWHILNVVPNSPAAAAGLISHSDYIVASQNGDLESLASNNDVLTGLSGGSGGKQALSHLVMQHSGSREGLLFYVYNRDYDIVRPVRLIPTVDGKLGCGVGYGLLHALPKAAGALGSGPVLFDADSAQPATEAEELFTPAQNMIPNITESTNNAIPPPPMTAHPMGTAYAPHHPKPHRALHQTAPKLDDYFEEQSRISRALDGGNNNRATSAASAPPPPPKKQ